MPKKKKRVKEEEEEQGEEKEEEEDQDPFDLKAFLKTQKPSKLGEYFITGGGEKEVKWMKWFVDSLVNLHHCKLDWEELKDAYGYYFVWKGVFSMKRETAGSFQKSLQRAIEDGEARLVLQLRAEFSKGAAAFLDFLYIAPSKRRKGEWGLFAARDFPENSTIGFCSGNIVKKNKSPGGKEVVLEEGEKVAKGCVEVYDLEGHICLVEPIGDVILKEPHFWFFGMNYLTETKDESMVNCFLECDGTVLTSQHVKEDEELVCIEKLDEEKEEEEEEEDATSLKRKGLVSMTPRTSGRVKKQK